LCFFCSKPLPAEPSASLTELCEKMLPISHADPHSWNRSGHIAPSAVMASFCARHTFESSITQVVAKGWPQSINWAALEGQVRCVESDLANIINDPGDLIVYPTGDETEKPKPLKRGNGPRMQCIFWLEFVQRMETSGPKNIRGAKSSFATFDRVQPGYYGEIGFDILYNVLCDMFPLVDIPPAVVHPLTPHEFIQRILVSEAAMQLIANDLKLDLGKRDEKKKAVEVLRESARYGAMKFPVDSSDEG
ncbi:hypothetical protein FB451DRAFT_966820, partial [Mycena latifolia]